MLFFPSALTHSLFHQSFQSSTHLVCSACCRWSSRWSDELWLPQTWLSVSLSLFLCVCVSVGLRCIDSSLLFYWSPVVLTRHHVYFLSLVWFFSVCVIVCNSSVYDLFWQYPAVLGPFLWLWQSVKSVSPLCVFTVVSVCESSSLLFDGLPVLFSSSLSVEGSLSLLFLLSLHLSPPPQPP